ncbi:MAG: acyl-ACP--UDP-N-acetylglucosamine O-acyltransferase [Elusimicrobia bacterium]|nr:acyl-ACP--UDP-N-acetylglucosamine O-acyltransferase [Elusimicrobiota bacterium]
MMGIHPTAVVHPAAKIDPSVEIGPFAVIGPDTVIGPGCFIGPHCVVEYATLGRENRLAASCFVGGPPQDLHYKGEPTRLVMGDRNTVREGATLNRGTTATHETRIGSGCLFMALSHVAHDCRVGNNVIMANATGLAGHVEVADNAILSTMIGVHQFTRIGRMVMVSAGSMIGKDVPPFCVAQGDRAHLRGLNLVGLRRSGLKPPAIRALKDAYATLFLSGLRLDEAAAKLRAAGPTPEVAEMLDFIAKTKRGVTRPLSGKAEEEEAEV